MTHLTQTKLQNEGHNNLVEEETYNRVHRDIYYAAKNHEKDYCPVLRDWGFYFKQDVGFEKRLKIMKKLTSFWDRRKIETIEFDDDFMIGGAVFGLYSFTDGTYITVCSIKSIERIRAFGNNDKPKDLLKFHAQSPRDDEGWEFYLFEDEVGTKLKLMLSDIHRTGKLRDKVNYYVPQCILDFQRELM